MVSACSTFSKTAADNQHVSFTVSHCQERRPSKKREFDWKLRLQRGNDEKSVKAPRSFSRLRGRFGTESLFGFALWEPPIILRVQAAE